MKLYVLEGRTLYTGIQGEFITTSISERETLFNKYTNIAEDGVANPNLRFKNGAFDALSSFIHYDDYGISDNDVDALNIITVRWHHYFALALRLYYLRAVEDCQWA